MALPIQQGLRFSGVTKDKITFPNVELQGDFSIEWVIKCTNTPSTLYGCILSNDTANNRIMLHNGIFYVNIAGNPYTTSIPSFNIFGEVLKVKVERVAGTIYMYLNDHLENTDPDNNGTAIFNTIGLTSGTSFKFRGEFYDLVIKDNGIKVLEYHLEEGQGTVLNDSSGNNKNGTIVGANWIIQKCKPLKQALKLKEWQYVKVDGSRTYNNYATVNTTGFKGVIVINALGTNYNGADVIAYNHLGLPVYKYSTGWNTGTELVRMGFNNTGIYMKVANEYTGFTDEMTPTMQQWKDFFATHPYQLVYKLKQSVMVPEEVYPDVFKIYTPKVKTTNKVLQPKR